jgi:hypothetical protein
MGMLTFAKTIPQRYFMDIEELSILKTMSFFDDNVFL